jgi:micrococcal nuclease
MAQKESKKKRKTKKILKENRISKDQRWIFSPVSWRVYDGDTILDLVLDLGFGVRIEIKTRLLGINAPEVRGPEKKKGLETKLFLGHAMDEAFLRKSLRVESHNKSGKFGRWLVTVWDGDVNLNELMVKNGLAEFKDY